MSCTSCSLVRSLALAVFLFALGLVNPDAGHAMQGCWGPEPSYEPLSFRRVSEAPDSPLAGNSDVRAHGWQAFRSSDPALYRMRRFTLPGDSALLSDGRVIRFVEDGNSQDGSIREIRVYGQADISPRFDCLLNADRGIFPALPRRVPTFPGYIHRQSAHITGDSYFGLWRSRNGRRGSLVAAYLDSANAPPPVILGRSGMNYGTIATFFFCGEFSFTVTNDAGPGQPLYMIRYVWSPTVERSGGLMRPMAARPLPC